MNADVIKQRAGVEGQRLLMRFFALRPNVCYTEIRLLPYGYSLLN